MFCDNCGTRVEDGQPFCPNCGKRMGGGASNASAASARPAYGNSRPAARPVSNSGGLLGKFNDMQGLEKIFFPIVLCLWIASFVLSTLHTFKYGLSYVQWNPLLSIIAVGCLTHAITFIVLDYFDKFTFKGLWLFNLIAAFVVLVVFAINWIDLESKLTAGGWIFFFLQIGLFGCSIMLMLEKMKK